ncbi:hypothetical protein [Rhizobium sp. 768_B6_N1_8]|uniref:hypothetical protein n=1 Tax=unclassified Rhizobium TaxID=2613769 RepID=UPI003F25A05F
MSERRADEFGMSGYLNKADMEADTAATTEAAGDYKSWYDEAILAANEAGYGPCSAADAIRGLAEEVTHYKQLAEEGTAPLIKSMKLEDGHFDLSVTGPIVEAMACAFVGQFKEGGSVNYMEMSLFDRDEPFQRYTVTVQKVGAKSPADLVNEARQVVANLKAEAQFLLDRLDDICLDDDTDELIRDWNGHVEPSIARLRQLVQVSA